MLIAKSNSSKRRISHKALVVMMEAIERRLMADAPLEGNVELHASINTPDGFFGGSGPDPIGFSDDGFSAEATNLNSFGIIYTATNSPWASGFAGSASAGGNHEDSGDWSGGASADSSSPLADSLGSSSSTAELEFDELYNFEIPSNVYGDISGNAAGNGTTDSVSGFGAPNGDGSSVQGFVEQDGQIDPGDGIGSYTGHTEVDRMQFDSNGNEVQQPAAGMSLASSADDFIDAGVKDTYVRQSDLNETMNGGIAARGGNTNFSGEFTGAEAGIDASTTLGNFDDLNPLGYDRGTHTEGSVSLGNGGTLAWHPVSEFSGLNSHGGEGITRATVESPNGDPDQPLPITNTAHLETSGDTSGAVITSTSSSPIAGLGITSDFNLNGGHKDDSAEQYFRADGNATGDSQDLNSNVSLLSEDGTSGGAGGNIAMPYLNDVPFSGALHAGISTPSQTGVEASANAHVELAPNYIENDVSGTASASSTAQDQVDGHNDGTHANMPYDGGNATISTGGFARVNAGSVGDVQYSGSAVVDENDPLNGYTNSNVSATSAKGGLSSTDSEVSLAPSVSASSSSQLTTGPSDSVYGAPSANSGAYVDANGTYSDNHLINVYGNSDFQTQTQLSTGPDGETGTQDSTSIHGSHQGTRATQNTTAQAYSGGELNPYFDDYANGITLTSDYGPSASSSNSATSVDQNGNEFDASASTDVNTAGQQYATATGSNGVNLNAWDTTHFVDGQNLVDLTPSASNSVIAGYGYTLTAPITSNTTSSYTLKDASGAQRSQSDITSSATLATGASGYGQNSVTIDGTQPNHDSDLPEGIKIQAQSMGNNGTSLHVNSDSYRSSGATFATANITDSSAILSGSTSSNGTQSLINAAVYENGTGTALSDSYAYGSNGAAQSSEDGTIQYVINSPLTGSGTIGFHPNTFKFSVAGDTAHSGSAEVDFTMTASLDTNGDGQGDTTLFSGNAALTLTSGAPNISISGDLNNFQLTQVHPIHGPVLYTLAHTGALMFNSGGATGSIIVNITFDTNAVGSSSLASDASFQAT